MARPKPVPWTRLVTELSSRVKGSKIVSMSSGAMPMPSSLTVKRREAKLARGLGVWTRSNSTVPPLGGVLHGIGDDVDENLVDAELVAHHETVADPGDVDPEVLALGEGPGPRDGNHVLGQLRELELREVEGGLAALDLGHVEDVVEQAQHVQGGGLDLAGVVAHEVGVAGVAEEERGQAHDGVHGGADVVAHVGQERALGLVGHLGHGEGLPQHLLVAALPGAVGQHRHAATAAVDLHVARRRPRRRPGRRGTTGRWPPPCARRPRARHRPGGGGRPRPPWQREPGSTSRRRNGRARPRTAAGAPRRRARGPAAPSRRSRQRTRRGRRPRRCGHRDPATDPWTRRGRAVPGAGRPSHRRL